jgi:voltage-gated potassium channel
LTGWQGPRYKRNMVPRARRHGRLYYLLVCLVLFIILYSFSGESLAKQLVLDVVLVGVLISAAVLVRQTRPSLVISLALGIPWVISVWVDVFVVLDRNLYFLTTATGIAFLIWITRILLLHVMTARRVTADTIYGAVCVYLLLGVAWSSAYRLLEILSPGSFAGPLGIDPQTGREISNYAYFSFTTLTTLGYGDITPLTAPARAVAILEAVAGPLYIAVLISRLVSIYVSQSAKTEADR